MTSETSSIQALRARIIRLETQARRLRRALVVLGTVAIAGGLVAAKAPPKPVVASAFVLVDAAGQTRAQLAVAEDDTATFILRSASGSGDAGFLVSASGASALRLRAPKRSVALEAADDGRAELRLHDHRTKSAASMAIAATGTPRVALNDARGKVVFDSAAK